MRRFKSATLAAILSLVTASCGGGDPSATGLAAAVVTSPVPVATSTAAPIAAIVGTDVSAGFPQLDSIPSNFSMTGMLTPSWGTGAVAEPGLDVGAFRFLCKPSHLSYDDPIVFPGQVGRAHLHMFFGNTQTNANSDYASLRTSGASTCNNALNRSAYWVPALMNGRGQVVLPEYISIYYKRYPATDPRCAQGRGCIGLPRGLRYIFGRTMQGALPVDPNAAYFNCDGAGATPGHYATLTEAAKFCPSGANIGAVLIAPDCWNGTDLDSPDHRSHMSYAVQDGYGHAVCPATHPYRIPTFTLGAWYKTDDTLDRSGDPSPDRQTWYFSSDRMAGMTPMTSGTTFHADWFGAWDDTVMKTWLDNCVNLLLSCSGGDLGNGSQMSFSQEYNRDYPRRVDTPTDPKIADAGTTTTTIPIVDVTPIPTPAPTATATAAPVRKRGRKAFA